MASTNDWQPSLASEKKKLSGESGWALAGTTSHSFGRGRRLLNSRGHDSDGGFSSSTTTPSPSIISNSSEDSESVPPSSSGAAQPLLSSLPELTKPPAHSRAIVEVNPLKELMEKYMSCPLCNGAMKVTFDTCCIATGINLDCEDCTFHETQHPSSASLPLPDDAGSPLIERSTDYAINILFVLGFLSVGDGGKEANRVLGLLGLPNSATMEKRSFSIIEGRLSPHIQALADEILRENLEEEVLLVLGDARDDNGIRLYDLWKEKKLSHEHYPKLTGSTDMGWQKRSSGRSFSSLSGHALFVSSRTRKPIALEVKATLCRICSSWEKNNDGNPVPPAHRCVANHEGSPGSMEPQAILDMYKHLYDRDNVIIEQIVCDDDSAVRSKMKWSHADYTINGIAIPTYLTNKGVWKKKSDLGGVPGYMPLPSFVADPSHRKKTLKGDLFKMFYSLAIDKKTLTKCDIYRISTNFAFMTRSLPGVDPSEYVTRGKSVVEHHFDDHQYCGAFCRRKLHTEEERIAKKKFYRCKMKDKDLYEALKRLVARFVTHEALLEVGHGMDTLVNESINNSISWVAPKNKTYSTTQSLNNRIAFAVCINGVGTLKFFERMFVKCGIAWTPDIAYYVRQIDAARTTKIVKTKTGRAKRKRQEAFHGRLLGFAEIAKKERARRDGVAYEPGIGFERTAAAATSTKPPAKKRAKRDMSKVRCKHCQKLGHCMRSSLSCLKNPKHPEYSESSAHEEQTQQDANEMDLLDSIQPDDEEFFDAFEYVDDDEDEDLVEVNAAGDAIGRI